MTDFDQFVKALGDHAKHYTPEQLKQLHIEVQKLAQVLLEVHRARTKTAQLASDGFPQPVLDRTRETVH